MDHEEEQLLLLDENQISDDTIWFPSPSSNGAPGETYLIYVITGNPGVIHYYDTFMSTLSESLGAVNASSAKFDICGSSLLGFEFSDISGADGIRNDIQPSKKRLASLRDQILATEVLIAKAYETYVSKHSVRPKVILMGHSIGCYMMLEALRRRAEGGQTLEGMEFVGGVCLFPTITNIGKSMNGRFLRMLYHIPYFIELAAMLVTALFYFVSLEYLAMLVGIFAWMPKHVALTSAKFIKSPHGVEQALFMARDEMEQVKEDLWTSDIWGAASEVESRRNGKGKKTGLMFYFGENDGWVADHTRDELIRRRGQIDETELWKPKMLIDKSKIPHGFVINHSKELAEKCIPWILELVGCE